MRHLAECDYHDAVTVLVRGEQPATAGREIEIARLRAARTRECTWRSCSAPGFEAEQCDRVSPAVRDTKQFIRRMPPKACGGIRTNLRCSATLDRFEFAVGPSEGSNFARQFVHANKMTPVRAEECETWTAFPRRGLRAMRCGEVAGRYVEGIPHNLVRAEVGDNQPSSVLRKAHAVWMRGGLTLRMYASPTMINRGLRFVRAVVLKLINRHQSVAIARDRQPSPARMDIKVAGDQATDRGSVVLRSRPATRSTRNVTTAAPSWFALSRTAWMMSPAPSQISRVGTNGERVDNVRLAGLRVEREQRDPAAPRAKRPVWFRVASDGNVDDCVGWPRITHRIAG